MSYQHCRPAMSPLPLLLLLALYHVLHIYSSRNVLKTAHKQRYGFNYCIRLLVFDVGASPSYAKVTRFKKMLSLEFTSTGRMWRCIVPLEFVDVGDEDAIVRFGIGKRSIVFSLDAVFSIDAVWRHRGRSWRRRLCVSNTQIATEINLAGPTILSLPLDWHFLVYLQHRFDFDSTAVRLLIICRGLNNVTVT